MEYRNLLTGTDLCNALENAINTNEKMKGAYFFKPKHSANARREDERRFLDENKDFNFTYEDYTCEVVFNYSQSCKNIYYSLSIYLDGEKKDIRFLKKVLKNINLH